MGNHTRKNQNQQRASVLILSHGDGTLEVFAERHIDVHISRVPVASSLDAERLVDENMDRLLPHRYRPLYWPNMRRAVGSTRPLYPSVLARSMATAEAIDALSQFASTAESEVMLWS